MGRRGGEGPPPRRGGRGQQWVQKTVGRGNRGKGARGMAAGWGVGNPALRELA